MQVFSTLFTIHSYVHSERVITLLWKVQLASKYSNPTIRIEHVLSGNSICDDFSNKFYDLSCHSHWYFRQMLCSCIWWKMPISPKTTFWQMPVYIRTKFNKADICMYIKKIMTVVVKKCCVFGLKIKLFLSIVFVLIKISA